MVAMVVGSLCWRVVEQGGRGGVHARVRRQQGVDVDVHVMVSRLSMELARACLLLLLLL